MVSDARPARTHLDDIRPNQDKGEQIPVPHLIGKFDNVFIPSPGGRINFLNHETGLILFLLTNRVCLKNTLRISLFAPCLDHLDELLGEINHSDLAIR